LTDALAPNQYRLLTEFRRLFEGEVYKHRASNQGDFVAMHLYEDLIAIDRSSRLIEAVVERKDRVLNVQNRRRGVTARRGDGTFGELIPGETAIADTGYLVSRGPIATVEIGIEVKVLAKAMIKQIDRVIMTFGIRWPSSGAAAGSRFRSPWWVLTVPRTLLAMKAIDPFQRPAPTGFSTLTRKRLKPNAGCAPRQRPSSMSFWFYASKRPTNRPTRSIGTTTTRLG